MARPLAAGPCAALLLSAAGCPTPETGVPLDRAVFPTGLAVSPSGDRLVVVSSSFDLAFDDGALLMADLPAARAALAAQAATVPEPGDRVAEGAYTRAAVLPPFGGRPVFASTGERFLVATRGTNRVASVDLDASAGFGCPGALPDGTPKCGGDPPSALQLPENDPFDVVILRESRDAAGALTRIDGLVALLSSSVLYVFHDDRSRPGAAQMGLDQTLDLGGTVRGVRSIALRTRNNVTHVVAGLDVQIGPNTVGAAIGTFLPQSQAVIRTLDVTSLTGSAGVRDLLVLPGEGGAADVVIAVLRGPDAIARFEVDDATVPPSLRLAGLSQTCATPTSLAVAPAGGVVRVLLTCQDGQVVEALDPLTLAPTDAVRFLGRAPYDVAVNTAVDPPEAYVSFFLDNSVGVVRLVDDAGAPRLVVQGRIGAPAPKPEDGRE